MTSGGAGQTVLLSGDGQLKPASVGVVGGDEAIKNGMGDSKVLLGSPG